MTDTTPCPHHPGILLPDKMTCPLCAQDARTRAYEAQRREMARQLQWAVQGLLRPAKEDQNNT